MTYPTYVHSVFAMPCAEWPVIGQQKNQCSFTAMTNALNCLAQQPHYHVEDFVREVGPLFQPELGGTLPPLKAWQLRKRGFGSHFGNLRFTDCEKVLCQLTDQGIPVIVDLHTGLQIGRQRIYGRHAVVLVGYSDEYVDSEGILRQEYYILDSEWPRLHAFALDSNDVDRDGDGLVESYPGNRTLSRAEFLRMFSTRCYAPIFATPAAHTDWYTRTFQARRPSLWQWAVTGSNDRLRSCYPPND